MEAQSLNQCPASPVREKSEHRYVQMEDDMNSLGQDTRDLDLELIQPLELWEKEISVV